MSKASIGKKKSEKHKQNMSKAFKNKKVSLKTRKKISNTLKGQSLEERGHKLNCSCSFCKAKRKELINKNNHNWHGGISKLPYSFDFNKNLKEQVRKRDNYICQNCNITQKEHLLIYKSKLSVHHIDYDKINSKENNLITLCHKCNIKANFNRKKWKSYFNSNK